MIKLSFLLKEIVINEFNKSQLDFIASKLNLKRDNDFDAIMNALDSQGIKYSELKDKISNNEITSFEDLKALKKQSKSDVTKSVKSDAEKVYEDDNFLIVVPFTYAASCYYGAGTKWCTTDKDASYWRRYVLEYNRTLYYIFNKTLPESNPLYKVALEVNKEGEILNMYDALDKRIDYLKYFDKIEKKVGYNLLDKVDFKSQNEKIRPLTHEEIKNNLEDYIDSAEKNDANIKLNGIKITTLPLNLKKVSNNLELEDTLITALPPGLKYIGGHLILDNTPITSLPQDLKIEGDLYLKNTKIESLSPDLECQDVYLKGTPLSKNPTELEKVKRYKGIRGNIYT